MTTLFDLAAPNAIALLNNGDDFMSGNNHPDFIRGGFGDDYIEGWLGNDMLFGDAGSDTIWAGGNNDFIDGGSGYDFAVFDGSAWQWNAVSNVDGTFTLFGLTGPWTRSRTSRN